MNKNNIHITEADYESLRLRLSALSGDPRVAKNFAKLRDELDRAIVVKARPPDVVGLNSSVRLLDLDSGEVDQFTLTAPEHADPTRGKLSVFAPLGTAILGYAEGDEFSWDMPGGPRRLRLVAVANPPVEATV